MIPADTDPAAHAVQMEIYRRMSPERRVELAFRMSEDVRRIALEGIQSRHPHYSEQQARRALFRLVLGDDLVRQMWPHEALIDP